MRATVLFHLSERKTKVTARSMRTLIPAVAMTAAILAVFLLLEGGDTTASTSTAQLARAGAVLGARDLPLCGAARPPPRAAPLLRADASTRGHWPGYRSLASTPARSNGQLFGTIS